MLYQSIVHGIVIALSLVCASMPDTLTNGLSSPHCQESKAPEHSDSGKGNLEAPRSLKILVIGRKNVGKSTFVRAMINYMTFQSMAFKEILEDGDTLTTLVPTQPPMYDESLDMCPNFYEMFGKDFNRVTTLFWSFPHASRIRVPGTSSDLTLIDTQSTKDPSNDIEVTNDIGIIKLFMTDKKISMINYVFVLVESSTIHLPACREAVYADLQKITPGIDMRLVKFIITKDETNNTDSSALLEFQDYFADKKEHKDERLEMNRCFAINSVFIMNWINAKFTRNHPNQNRDVAAFVPSSVLYSDRSCEALNRLVDVITKDNLPPYRMPFE